MPITLSLATADLDDDNLQELTRQLCRDLRDEAGVEAALATQPAARGQLSARAPQEETAANGGIITAAIADNAPLVVEITARRKATGS